jgi:hypothetical protein
MESRVGPNQSLQQTAAAMQVYRSSTAQRAAAAAELCRSAPRGYQSRVPGQCSSSGLLVKERVLWPTDDSC